MNLIAYLSVLVALLAVVTLVLSLICWILTRRVARLENDMLGVQYNLGLHAIELEAAGIRIHGGTRELAYYARQGQPDPPEVLMNTADLDRADLDGAYEEAFGDGFDR